jgi:hypothetical protein
MPQDWEGFRQQVRGQLDRVSNAMFKLALCSAMLSVGYMGMLFSFDQTWLWPAVALSGVKMVLFFCLLAVGLRAASSSDGLLRWRWRRSLARRAAA